MQAFEAWKVESETKHNAAMQAREAQYQREMEELRGFQHNQDSVWLTRCAETEEKYKADIAKLQDELQVSHTEKIQTEKDFTEKLEKAQAFYEKELAVLQQSQSSSHEEQLALLRQQQEKLRQDFLAQEGELRKQIDSLSRQLAEAEDISENQKSELDRLRAELGSKDSNTESISQLVSTCL